MQSSPANAILVLAALSFGSITVSNAQEDSRQFRGNQSSGIAEACPETWSETEHVRWEIDVPGEGWSAPVILGDRLFLTTAVCIASPRGTSSEPEPYRGGGGYRRSDLTEATYEWQVHCFDAASGARLWERVAKTGRPALPRHNTNTYATETPVTDGRHVYAYFGMTGVYCYDLEGNLQWSRDLGQYEMRAGWGTASSPVLYRDKLILQVDNQEQSFLIALDSESGKTAWRVARPEVSQYSSPIIWKNRLRDEVIVGGEFYRSYDPLSGELLWELDMDKGRSSATPIAAGDRLFVGTEFRNRGGRDDGGGFLFAVQPGGAGNISLDEGQTESEFIEWKTAKSNIQMASPVFCEGHLYFLERRAGILNCVDASTGSVAYRRRLPGARAFWASPWTCGGRVYCLDDNGTTFIIAGGKDFEVLAQNRLNEQTWATPAIAQGRLYLRTLTKLYCIESPESSN